jgi:hypothetical protein
VKAPQLCYDFSEPMNPEDREHMFELCRRIDRETDSKNQPRAEATADFQAMGILRCDACGDGFVIYHSPAFVNKSVADRQAYWLEKVPAEEHERDKKHPDRIELPD